jgi:hypothetical protein
LNGGPRQAKFENSSNSNPQLQKLEARYNHVGTKLKPDLQQKKEKEKKKKRFLNRFTFADWQ